MSENVKIFGLKSIPFIRKGDNIAQIIINACQKERISLRDKDIILIAQTIITKSLGRVKNLNDIKPSQKAYKIYNKVKHLAEVQNIPIKSPELIQAIIDESKKILKTEHVIITETHHGFICADAAIDKSNINGGSKVGFLPKDPDLEAEKIRNKLNALTGKQIGVIITDSFGRPFRKGSIGVSVGISGISPIKDKRGEKDLYGKELQSTIIAQADNLASAAQLVMGEADEGVPVVIIRGYNFNFDNDARIPSIIRAPESDLFREDVKRNFKKVLKNRRSYKLEYSNRIIGSEKIRKCINLARWAPSAHNAQPWRYIILERGTLREKLINRMNEKWKSDLKKDGKPNAYISKKVNRTRTQFLNCPMLILLCMSEGDLEEYPDDERSENEFLLGVQSISASATYLLLALEYEGLAACWYCAPLFAKETVRKALSLPSHLIPMGFITTGYPKKSKISAPYRKKLHEIIFKIDNK